MTAAPTKYCDLVMKGGITSGIVYPNAVLALAESFRFKNIGGTSAGAIAAAATAAAAVGDRRKANGAAFGQAAGKVGFEGLRTVAAQLSTSGFIYGLFQPARGSRNAYRLIVTLAGNAGGLRRIAALLFAVVAIAPLETLLVAALLLGLGYGVGDWPGLLAAALPSLLCAYAAGALAAVHRIARVARRNLLGLCSGMRVRAGGKPALTEWLHEVLQTLSGKAPDAPLTFDDLWTADRYPGEPETEHAVTLQMITTGVSHHEPRTLPFTDARFWFLREEFDLLFPRQVVDWMVEHGGGSDRIGDRIYYRLPPGGRLPVLVAMRMSLSFPLLISAVPLHEPARRERAAPEADEPAAQDMAPSERSMAQSTEGLTTGGEGLAARITAFRICWFSDGGISSNFPIHLFDAPLPLWPTFAINLVYPKTDDSARSAGSADPIGEAVFLPTENNQGWQRTYQPIAQPGAARELAGFLFGLIATMQNWRDLLQSRAPGHRDRIVHVSLGGDEGGMNLDMEQPVLDRISAKGRMAGERFATFSFDNHHWIRWRNLASAWQRHAVGIARSADREPRIPDYQAAYDTARKGDPPPPSYKFSSAEKRKEAERLLAGLTEQGREWDDLGPDFTDGAPRPLPQMRISPIY